VGRRGEGGGGHTSEAVPAGTRTGRPHLVEVARGTRTMADTGRVRWAGWARALVACTDAEPGREGGPPAGRPCNWAYTGSGA
jgi:hypothetical protein